MSLSPTHHPSQGVVTILLLGIWCVHAKRINVPTGAQGSEQSLERPNSYLLAKCSIRLCVSAWGSLGDEQGLSKHTHIRVLAKQLDMYECLCIQRWWYELGHVKNPFLPAVIHKMHSHPWFSIGKPSKRAWRCTGGDSHQWRQEISLTSQSFPPPALIGQAGNPSEGVY